MFDDCYVRSGVMTSMSISLMTLCSSLLSKTRTAYLLKYQCF